MSQKKNMNGEDVLTVDVTNARTDGQTDIITV